MAVIMDKLVGKLEPAMKQKAFTFLAKLMENPDLPGLHIEPIVNARDPKVRTGRVDQGFRAVLFKLTSRQGVDYVVYGFFPHDEANSIAEKVVLSRDPRTGISKITIVEAPPPAVAEPAQPPKPEKPIGMLAAAGFTVAELTEGLGLDEALARRVIEAADEDEILAIAGDTDDVTGQMIVALSTGVSIEDIREEYGLERVEEDPHDETNIREGLKGRAGQAAFAWIESNEELQRVIDEGDFGAWRVFLHPEQRVYVDKRYNGSARLSGGAGTGKTVVLLHRTRALVRRDPTPRVLLTTFTRNLAEALKRDLRRLDPTLPLAQGFGDPGATVSGIDAFASSVLRAAGARIGEAAERVLGVATTEVSVDPQAQSTAWSDALDTAGGDLPPVVRSPAFLAEEYAAVVLPNRVTTKDEYLRVRRPGRGVRLDRTRRAAVWDVVAAYRATGRAYGRVDFDEVATLAAEHLDLRAPEHGRPFDHVLVDEGQDLSPTRWQLLRAAVEDGPDDLFIAEDSHQRIYGQRITLSRYGIRIVGRSRRLRLNYRTTAQVLRWAMSVLDGGDYVDIEGEAEDHTGYRSARSGPRPEVIAADSPSDELDKVAETLRGWLAEDGTAPETLAVLVRDVYQQQRVVDGLGERGVRVRSVGREGIPSGQPVVMTMHRSKGTEFGRVILYGLREGAIPAVPKDQEYDESARLDAELRERSLLYVAATRARDVLAVSYSGELTQLVRP